MIRKEIKQDLEKDEQVEEAVKKLSDERKKLVKPTEHVVNEKTIAELTKQTPQTNAEEATKKKTNLEETPESLQAEESSQTEESLQAEESLQTEESLQAEESLQTEESLQAEESSQTEENLQIVEKNAEAEVQKTPNLFKKLFKGLTKTRDNILNGVENVLKNFQKIDEELFEELEEVLICADFGVDTTLEILDKTRKVVKERKITDPEKLKEVLREIIADILTSNINSPIVVEDKPNIILIVGVNGVGKTTTIGKLSHKFTSEGKNVILAAADTFRAAAIEQLQIWADRAGVSLIKNSEGSDPTSVIYDAISATKARKADILICDTAGRLQNKVNLMKELEKISRVIEREYPEAHKEVLIVLDATTGQNALSQVKLFKEVANVDGIILTKLDGTAKGGAIVGICATMNVPVKYIGVGETIEDLQEFNATEFAKALFTIDEN
ncbi:MAG: signal recognition particle-docking protein FtsY [Epulopiscium sp. Nuni2H_MBin003]|nr:MAG: signal recognition particle-docking protein FtsY [Epulopiscium sp. Nuni2H_MBin003]